MSDRVSNCLISGGVAPNRISSVNNPTAALMPTAASMYAARSPITPACSAVTPAGLFNPFGSMMSGRSTWSTRSVEHPVSAIAAITSPRFAVRVMYGSSRLVVVWSRMSVAQVEPDDERPRLSLLHEVVGVRVLALREDLRIPAREAFVRPEAHVTGTEHDGRRARAHEVRDRLREVIDRRELTQPNEIALLPVRAERTTDRHCARLVEQRCFGVVNGAAVVRAEPAREAGAHLVRREAAAVVGEGRETEVIVEQADRVDEPDRPRRNRAATEDGAARHLHLVRLDDAVAVRVGVAGHGGPVGGEQGLAWLVAIPEATKG